MLTRIVWEYNFVNKMFVTQFKLLSNLNPTEGRRLPAEILVFGGTYPLSENQVTSLGELVIANPQVKGLALNFTRIRDSGLHCLMRALKPKSWKAIRIYDRRLYSLDLTNNFIEQNGICYLLNLFYD